MKNIAIILTLAGGLIFFGLTNTSCKSTQTDSTNPTTQKTSTPAKDEKGRPQGDRKGPPKFSEVLKMMDKNGDEKISKTEAQGRLKEDFEKVDKNNDGFLTEDELAGPPRAGRRN